MPCAGRTFAPYYPTLRWANAEVDEQRALMGNSCLAYNVESNVKSFEAMMQFAHHLASRRRSSII